ncbi:MAG TPA: hypothetical protein VIB48_25175 [Acidimicrobiia bacterium]|jgi:hypothetical protein
MDGHQRRVWSRLPEEVDAFHRGERTTAQLVANLEGLVAAADVKDESLLHDFWNYRNDLLFEIAPGWFDSDRAILGGEARFRGWVAHVLASTDDDRT